MEEDYISNLRLHKLLQLQRMPMPLLKHNLLNKVLLLQLKELKTPLLHNLLKLPNLIKINLLNKAQEQQLDKIRHHLFSIVQPHKPLHKQTLLQLQELENQQVRQQMLLQPLLVKQMEIQFQSQISQL